MALEKPEAVATCDTHSLRLPRLKLLCHTSCILIIIYGTSTMIQQGHP